MKNKILGIFVMTLLIGLGTVSVSACTGFTASDDNTVLVGSNEDWDNYNFDIRFFPPKDGKNGMMFLEIPLISPETNGILSMYPIAGMNDQGLWYDIYMTPFLLPVNSSDKPYFTSTDTYYKDNFGEYCLSKFSTIDEIYDLSQNYNLEFLSNCNVLIVEATGNSAIFEGDDWIFKKGDFQVISNFLQSHPELGSIGNGYERYTIAVSMLENMTDLSVEYFTDICDATYQQKSYIWTICSWICDLKNQIIYFYHFHNYENVVVIDLNEELQKGEHSIYLGSLFEPDGNQAPAKPEPPTGDESGLPGEDIEFSVTKTSDPEKDKISYIFDWGDGTQSLWLYKTMGTIKASHNWTERGNYNVRVKARDMYGAESEWSDPLVISMSKIKITNRPQLDFLEDYPLLSLILQKLMQRLGL